MVTPIWSEGNDTNIDDLFTRIENALVAAGATKLVISTLATQPTNTSGASGGTGRHTLFLMPGNSVRPVIGGIGLVRGQNSIGGQPPILATYCFSGHKLLANITAASKTTTTITITHDNGGGTDIFKTGDHVVFFVSDNVGLNEGFLAPEATPGGSYSITRLNATQFSFTSGFSSSLVGTTGKCIALQNFLGTTCMVNGNGFTVTPSDAPLISHVWADEFGFGCVIEQSGQFQAFGARCIERDTSAFYGDVSLTSGSITAGSPATVNLVTPSPNIRVGQKVLIIHPGDPTTVNLAGDTGSFEQVTILTKPTDSQFTANIVNNYPAGALVGLDGLPWYATGRSNSAGQNSGSFDIVNKHALMFNVEGTRTSPVAPVYLARAEIPATATVADVNPDDAGVYRLRDIALQKTASPSKGWRGWIRPWFAFSHNSENPGDLATTGATILDDCKIFPNITLTGSGTFVVAIGPGVTP